jgi:HSP20 family protein
LIFRKAGRPSWWSICSTDAASDAASDKEDTMSLRSLFSTGENRNELARADLSPFGALQREIDRLFADFTRGWQSPGVPDLTPRMDVTERDGEIELTAELPGLEEKDVEVTLVDNVLTIRGEKKAEKEEKDQNRRIVERSYGAFSRSLELPAGIKPDDIIATMKNGVLTVKLPKTAQIRAEPAKIAIKSAA